jgi:hypothetical protein
MSHRWLKLSLVLSSALMLALPVVATAQTSRVEGMSLQGDYIKDYTGIFTYVNDVASVGNLVYGELGNYQGTNTPFDRSVGMVLGNISDGRTGVWSLHLREFTPALGQGDVTSSPSPNDTGLGSDPNFNTMEAFDLMWGKKFGTKSFGLRLNRSHGKVETEPLGGPVSSLSYDFSQTNPNFSRNVLGVGGGAGFELNPNTTAEVSVMYQKRTYEIDAPPAPTASDNGPTTFQVAARMMWQWQPNVMVVPVFKYHSMDLSETDGTPAGTFDNKLTGWQAGVAGNWSLGTNDLFVMGLTFAQNKIDQHEDVVGAGFAVGTITETYTPQLFMALETHVNPWLTLRFGANKGAWHKVKLEDKDPAPPLARVEISDSPFNMSLGAGVKIGTLQLDGVLNQAIAQNGLYFISGSSNTPLASKVTATYSF